MTPLRIAVIGGGYWGKKVIRETLKISQATGSSQLHAIVDNFPESISQCQQEFGPSLDYRTEYQALAKDPSLTGVHICTPNSTHFEVASTFLRQGKHVLVEKPLTLRTEEAYELVRLANENKAVLCVGHIHRFNNGVRELKRVITNGGLGDVYYLRLRWTALMNPQLLREVITDLAPHPFDICNYLLDAWPEKLSCKGRGYRTKQNEEVAFITADYKAGLIAHVEVSWLDRDKRREVTVVGSKGTAHLDCADQKLVVELSGGTQEIPVSASNTLGDEISHFYDCIRNNQNSAPYSNFSDGVLGARVVSLLEASRESMFQDRTIPVQLPIIPAIPAK
jgi:predicted dehydrogenase